MDVPNAIVEGAPTAAAVRNLPSVPSPAHDAAAQFAALLLEKMFAPVAKAIGFYGDTVVAAAANAITREPGNAATDALSSAIDSAARGDLR